MSDGGLAGSKVRRAKLTGCLLMVTAGVFLSGWLHERAHQPRQAMTSASSNTEGAMDRRNRSIASAFHFPSACRTDISPPMPRMAL